MDNRIAISCFFLVVLVVAQLPIPPPELIYPTDGTPYEVIQIGVLQTLPWIETVEAGVNATTGLPLYYANNGTFAFNGNMSYLANNMWWRNINNRGGIKTPNKTYVVNMTFFNTGATAAKASAVAANVTSGRFGNFSALFAPFSSLLTLAVGPSANTAHIPILAPYAAASLVYECGKNATARPPCTEAGRRRFDYVWGPVPPAEIYWQTTLNILKLKGAKSIAVWSSNDDFQKSLADGIVSTCDSLGIKVLTNGYLTVPVDSSAKQEVLADIVSQFKALNPDIIAMSNRLDTSCGLFVTEMKKQNLNPKAMFVSQCLNNPTVISKYGSDLRYMLDYVLWDRRLVGKEFTDTRVFTYDGTGPSSSEQYAQAFKNFSANYFTGGLDVDGINAPAGFASGYFVESAVEKAKSSDPVEINKVLSIVLENSFYGTLGFNTFGQNDKKQVGTVMFDKNLVLQLVSPLGSSTAELIYPFPEWDKREFSSSYLGKGSEIAMFVIYGLTIAYTATCFGFLIKHWNRRSVKASSPIFLSIMLGGSLVLYSTVPFWMLHTNEGSCHMRVWLLNLGFTLLFGTLVAKTHRIKAVFYEGKQQMKVSKFSNSKLMVICAVLVLIDMVILAVWSGVTQPNVQIAVIDPYRDALNFYQCIWPWYNWIFIGIEFLYKGLMIIYGLFLSVILWRYGNSMWVESKQIIFAMYNLIVFGLIGVALQSSLSESDPNTREVLFVTRSIVMFICGSVTVGVILLPRIMDPEGQEHKGKDVRGQRTAVAQTQMFEMEDKYDDLLKQYKILQEKYKSMKKIVREIDPEREVSVTEEDTSPKNSTVTKNTSAN
eukprot:TRINITY_DN10459_c0_g1_i1.p1 TRINITY_DN10459_c0_g1~~TRINITY_DN10459_c0_g1_i1.p1  ORF type:complete len:827 (-),score=177.16 TRINITY_DN10459_c0_g1_i1:146-2626(-)